MLHMKGKRDSIRTIDILKMFAGEINTHRHTKRESIVYFAIIAMSITLWKDCAENDWKKREKRKIIENRVSET